MPKGTFTPAIDCTNQQRPAIALQPVESSQIKAIGYDAATATLAITFTRGPGNVYLYENVSADTHLAFLSADSLGSYFGQHIQILPSKKYSADPAPEAQEDAQAA